MPAGLDLAYAALYFGISPSSHAAAYRRLSGLGDDSPTYLWRVKASERIMERYRQAAGFAVARLNAAPPIIRAVASVA